jgi:DNA-binding response OmpR family regulator
MLQSEPPSIRQAEASVSGDAVIRFGRFCVLPRLRQLLVDGQPVELGGRAFDLLTVLIAAPGTVFTKREIISRVWPDTVVEESNLKVQMSALRRVLNLDRDVIKTVHGRGYVFTGEVTSTSIDPDALARSGSAAIPSQLGPPVLPTGFPARSTARQQRASGSRMIVHDDQQRPVVIVIDDDPEKRDALHGLLRSAGLCVESFASAQEFLESLPPDRPGVPSARRRVARAKRARVSRAAGQGGIAPADHLHADVPMSVRAMKRGAVEFLTKPVHDQDLLDAIELALAPDHARRDAERAAVQPAYLLRQADAA